MRRNYEINICFNGQKYDEAIIDPHYEKGHSDHMSDELILDLVMTLHDQKHAPVKVDLKTGFSYFVKEFIYLNRRPYRLIWTTHKDEFYIGVINAFRIGPRLVKNESENKS